MCSATIWHIYSTTIWHIYSATIWHICQPLFDIFISATIWPICQPLFGTFISATIWQICQPLFGNSLQCCFVWNIFRQLKPGSRENRGNKRGWESSEDDIVDRTAGSKKATPHVNPEQILPRTSIVQDGDEPSVHRTTDINVYPEMTSIVQDHEELSTHRPTNIDGEPIPGLSNINQARNADYMSINQSNPVLEILTILNNNICKLASAPKRDAMLSQNVTSNMRATNNINQEGNAFHNLNIHDVNMNQPSVSRQSDMFSNALQTRTQNTFQNVSSFESLVSRPSVSFAPKLGEAISDDMKNKIWSGRFVNLQDLYDMEKPEVPQPSTLAIKEEPGQNPTLINMTAKRRPLSIQAWNSAWSVFMFVYIQKFPDEIQALLAYEQDVNSLANQGLDWVFSDKQFRTGKSSRMYAWDTLRPDLDRKLLYSMGRNSFRHSSSSSGGSQPFLVSEESRRATKVPKGFCIRYHTRGKHCQ